MPIASTSSTTDLVADVRRPVCAERPAGTDVTYDDRFQQLRGQVDALGTVGGRVDQERALDPTATSVAAEASVIDYAALAEEGRMLLREASKDLRVVCYVALARLHTHGLPGLAEGVAALEAFAETYWNDGFPPAQRERARGAALRFYVRRAADHLEKTAGGGASQADAEAARAAARGLEQLTSFWTEVLDGQAPPTGRLVRCLQERAEGSLREQQASRTEAPRDAQDGRGRERAARPQAGGSSEGRRHDALAAATATVDAEGPTLPAIERAVLGWVARAQDVDAERGRWYRIERALRWDLLRTLPPHRGRRTRVAPPSAQRRQALRDLARRGQHTALVREAEKTFAQSPFHLWLDLQRLHAEALAATAATEARAALCDEVRRLLHRLPALAGLAFDDGTPFADAATQAWAETLVGERGGGGEPGAAAPSSEGDPVETAYETAKERLRDGAFDEALRVLRGASLSTASGRARLRLRLRTASLCLEGGRPVLARPLLEDLGETVRERGLGRWEPRLAAAVWEALYDCYRALEQAGALASEEAGAGRAAAYAQLCCIDVCHAQQLGAGMEPTTSPRR